MTLLTILLTAFGLSMDAFAVSICSGIAIKLVSYRNAFTIAGFFGSFQAFMPLIGWLGGRLLSEFIRGIDHWIAFSLLGLIGARMIYGAVKGNQQGIDRMNYTLLFTLAVATSIDALAVGVSFAFLQLPVLLAAVMIGTVTFSLSAAGVFAGDRIGCGLGNKAEAVGGLVLIGLGFKILLQDLSVF